MSAGDLLAAKDRELQQLRAQLVAQGSTPARAQSWWRRLMGKT